MPTTDDLLAALSDADRTAALEYIARIEQTLEQRSKMASWLMDILGPKLIEFNQKGNCRCRYF